MQLLLSDYGFGLIYYPVMFITYVISLLFITQLFKTRYLGKTLLTSIVKGIWDSKILFLFCICLLLLTGYMYSYNKLINDDKYIVNTTSQTVAIIDSFDEISVNNQVKYNNFEYSESLLHCSDNKHINTDIKWAIGLFEDHVSESIDDTAYIEEIHTYKSIGYLGFSVSRNEYEYKICLPKEYYDKIYEQAHVTTKTIKF